MSPQRNSTRSLNLGLGTLLGGGQVDVFEVPADTTVLVKAISLYNPAAVASTAYLSVRRAGDLTTLERPVVPAGAGVSVDWWLAMMPGWRLVLTSGGSDVLSYSVSGALLPGVADATYLELLPARR